MRARLHRHHPAGWRRTPPRHRQGGGRDDLRSAPDMTLSGKECMPSNIYGCSDVQIAALCDWIVAKAKTEIGGVRQAVTKTTDVNGAVSWTFPQAFAANPVITV